MKDDFMVIKMAVCGALMLALGAGDVSAQMRTKTAGNPVVRIQQLTGYGPRALIRSPDSSGGSRRGVREWAELAVQFDTDPEWIDEVTFQYYALLYHRTTGDYTLLKGSVTYVDVARGRSHLGVAYIRPNALARLGEIRGVAVEALVKGEVVASFSEGRLAAQKPLPVDPPWWQNPKLVPREGYIVEKSKTPFALLNFDDYEAAK